MNYKEAKDQFIQGWGQLGASWGINRTMSQINALLLLAPKPLSTDEIMEELNISRGNANMNIRELIAWGIVRKSFVPGDRKEYFYSVKDMWEIAKLIARERRKRELEPLLLMLNEVKGLKGESQEAVEFRKVTSGVEEVAKKADSMFDLLLKLDSNKFFKWFMRK
jgi:DNA-binding transcriptional regulator GbsR (MarR family)